MKRIHWILFGATMLLGMAALYYTQSDKCRSYTGEYTTRACVD